MTYRQSVVKMQETIRAPHSDKEVWATGCAEAAKVAADHKDAPGIEREYLHGVVAQYRTMAGGSK